MKELSIEQKAKRYDEAIDVAKRNYETIVQMDDDCTFAKEGIVNTFHHIFPELKESEDERIKKRIIHALHGDVLDIEETNKALAWLEKQSEQTSDKIVEKARTEKQRVLLTETDGSANIDWDCRSLDDVKLLLEYGLDYIKKLENQGEQKLAPALDIEIPFGAKDSELQEATYNIPKGFHAEIKDNEVFIKKDVKQNPAWTEEDDEMLEDVRSNFEYNKGVMTHALIEQYNHFFDKIKHLKPQPQQEWSEEDKAKIVKLKSFIAQCNGFNKENRNKAFDLIDSINPQSTWKPTDEQMKQLGWVAEQNKDNMIGKELMTLFHDLRKLREE